MNLAPKCTMTAAGGESLDHYLADDHAANPITLWPDPSAPAPTLMASLLHTTVGPWPRGQRWRGPGGGDG